MKIKKIKKAMKLHGKILLKGFIKMLFGTMSAVLIVLAVYGFCVIPRDVGYAAVGDFTLAAMSLDAAVFCVYIMGGNKKGAKK